MLLNRQVESKVISLLESSPAITLLGPRQVGKTTLAKHLMKNLPKESLYLDLQNRSDLQRVRGNSLFFPENKDKCVVIDEVQRYPEIFAQLRGYIDAYRVPGRFILLGSASPVILLKTIESLTGRNIYIELSGILWREVPPDITVQSHWFRGGFPTPLLSKKSSFLTPWYASFIRSFIELDLPQIGIKAPPLTLYRLISMIAHTQGGLWNASNLANALGVSSPTISFYRDFLEKTYFLRVLPPFFTNAKKRIIKSPKVYIKDSGLLHYLLNINDFNPLMGHPVVGTSWEGYVIEQIISYINTRFHELIEFSFYRTREGTECDLVISRGGKPLAAVEVKLSGHPTMTKGLTNAIKDLETLHNFIVIPDCGVPYTLKNRVVVTDLPDVLSRLTDILA